MIYDCFTLFNELDLLEIRLNVLYDYVDYFVIAEGNKTHTGKDKDLFFEQNKERFSKFENKIRYVKVEDFPDLSSSKSDAQGNKWLYENYQRDAIMRGLYDCKDDDIVIISDLDEIPNPKAIQEYKDGICILKQYTFYYSLNTLNITNMYSKGAKICRYKDLINPLQEISQKNQEYCAYSKYGLPTYLRFCTGKKITNGGWHFSYLGTVEDIIKKRNSIVEQQFNTEKNMSPKEIQQTIDSGKDILGRDCKYVNLYFSNIYPDYLIENEKKYSKYINKTKQKPFYFAMFRAKMQKIIAIRTENKNGKKEKYLKLFGIKIKLYKGKVND